jgi:hypothetical protein
MMKYTVTMQNKYGKPAATISGLSKSQAVKEARRMADDPENADNQVFVTWFRKSDGQHGYLNPDGDHAITGKSWI